MSNDGCVAYRIEFAHLVFFAVTRYAKVRGPSLKLNDNFCPYDCISPKASLATGILTAVGGTCRLWNT